MVDFNVKCPKNYPIKCNLLDTEKYKGFLMYRFQRQSDYVIPTGKIFPERRLTIFSKLMISLAKVLLRTRLFFDDGR